MNNKRFYKLIMSILIIVMMATYWTIHYTNKLIGETIEETWLRHEEVIEVVEVVEEVKIIEVSEEDLYRQMIREYCTAYGYDNPVLAISISRLETGNWKSEAFKSNNWGGISRREVPLEYENLCKGLEAYMQTLMWYQEQGLITVEQIGKKYCAINYENWCKSVNQIMEEEKAYGND